MNTFFKTPDTDWFKQRLTIAIYLVTAAFAILFLRLFYLQVIAGKEFKRLSENNCIRLQRISPSRGLIFDRNGSLIVDNRPSFDLQLTLKDTKDPDRTVKRLSFFTGVPEELLKERISVGKKGPSYMPILLIKDINRDILARIESHEYDLPGVSIAVQPRREYVYPKSAAHLIGYLGEISEAEMDSGKYPGSQNGDYIGKYGVEKTFENDLKGEFGGRQVEVNASGQVIRVLQTVDPLPGDNIYLTIDQKLQRRTEKLFEGKVGSAVAIDPNNGEILAMISNPSFDQNLFVNGLSREDWKVLNSDIHRPMQNKAIQAEYPPASTYKIITAMAGLEEGIIDENYHIFCTGRYLFGNRVFNDWKKEGHGHVNVVSALSKSCDVFFYQLGTKIGVDRLAWYARGCGMGTLTGIDLDHESKGLIPTQNWKEKNRGDRWHPGETLSIAIGQGYNLATPIQVAMMTAVVANNGRKYKPLIVKKIETDTGEVIFQSAGIKTGVIPVGQKTIDLIKRGMFEVVNIRGGTAYGSRIEELHMCGKTGTAQVVGRKGPDTGAKKNLAYQFKSHGWFTAYAPAENPQIAVSVIVEHGESGSGAAAPIARDMIKTYLLGEPEEIPVAGIQDSASEPESETADGSIEDERTGNQIYVR